MENRRKEPIMEKEVELISQREVLEGLSPSELQEFITDGLKKVEDLYRILNLAADVLQGYGR